MIVNIADLPDAARQPFLLSLRLQALSITVGQAGESGVIPRLREPLASELLSIVKWARREKLVGSDTVGIFDEKVEHLDEAAELLWSIGLAHLHKAIGEGDWFPAAIDLASNPKDSLAVKKGSGPSRR